MKYYNMLIHHEDTNAPVAADEMIEILSICVVVKKYCNKMLLSIFFLISSTKTRVKKKI
jgi:hypothetical protein